MVVREDPNLLMRLAAIGLKVIAPAGRHKRIKPKSASSNKNFVLMYGIKVAQFPNKNPRIKNPRPTEMLLRCVKNWRKCKSISRTVAG